MSKALSLAYVLQVPIVQMAINLDARIVYFPDQKVLIKPIVTISPLGEVLLHERPEITYGDDAEKLYNPFRGRLDGKDIMEVEVPGHILAWAKFYPDLVPTEKFQDDLYGFLLPCPPETTEAENISVNGEGLDVLVSAIYVRMHELLLEYKMHPSEEGTGLEINLQYGQEAINSYTRLLLTATERKIVHVLNPFLAMIKDVPKENVSSILQSLAVHLKNLVEQH